MAWAALSATTWALRAGEGCGDGTTSITLDCGRMPGKRGMGTASFLAAGKAFSTSFEAYVSTRTLPACATARSYLPRLNPAIGNGRSETQWEICSSLLFLDFSSA